MPRATINDVATAANVSTATVSRVLNGHKVASSTADRVWTAVGTLDYTPNALTRGVFAGRSNTIGVIIRDLNSPFYLELMRGIDEGATQDSSLVMFANTFNQIEREAAHVQTMDEQRVRGLILTTGPSTDVRTKRLAEGGTPCVIVARDAPDPVPNLHSIALDNHEAGRLIATHLVGCGRKSIGVLSGGVRASQNERIDGLRETLGKHDVVLHEDVIRAAETADDVGASLEEVFTNARAAGRPIDALVCLTGLLTTRAYEVLNKRGCRIPEDVALIAMDDFPWAKTLGITVVAQPSFDMGVEAATLITNGNENPQHIVKKPQLVIRQSCGESDETTE